MADSWYATIPRSVVSHASSRGPRSGVRRRFESSCRPSLVVARREQRRSLPIGEVATAKPACLGHHLRSTCRPSRPSTGTEISSRPSRQAVARTCRSKPPGGSRPGRALGRLSRPYNDALRESKPYIGEQRFSRLSRSRAPADRHALARASELVVRAVALSLRHAGTIR